MLRITIQLADTLVIIHGTHAYYCGVTEQWFSVVGTEQLEVVTSAKTIVLCISLSGETTEDWIDADISVSLGCNLS